MSTELGAGLFPDVTTTLLEPNNNSKLNRNDLKPVIVFSGVTATGKDRLAAEIKESGMDVSILGFGDMLSAALGVEKNKLPEYKPADLEPFYPKIIDVALQNAPTLLTAHPVFRQGGTLCFTPGIYTAMSPVAFVVITSEEHQINAWREQRHIKDGRESKTEDEGEIRLMQHVTQAIIYTFSETNGAGLIAVRNAADNLKQNTEFLKSELTNWLGKYC